MTDTPSQFAGARVRYFRRRKRWSQVRLAIQCDLAGHHKLTPSVLVQIEGHRRGRNLTLEEVWALAEVLEVSPADLMPPVHRDDAPSADVVLDREGVLALAHELVEELENREWENNRGGH